MSHLTPEQYEFVDRISKPVIMPLLRRWQKQCAPVRKAEFLNSFWSYVVLDRVMRSRCKWMANPIKMVRFRTIRLPRTLPLSMSIVPSIWGSKMLAGLTSMDNRNNLFSYVNGYVAPIVLPSNVSEHDFSGLERNIKYWQWDDHTYVSDEAIRIGLKEFLSKTAKTRQCHGGN